MDSIIEKEFDRCLDAGLCRSDVEGLRTKWIKGPSHMIAQYHPTWQIVKRKPYFTHPSLTEPFCDQGFNFTKVRDTEILAKYYVQNDRVVFLPMNSDVVPEGIDTLYTILLNVSPICGNHHLVVPNLKECYNQVWRYELTSDLLSMCVNSERPDYVLFFNSLGGFSSVNHLHFQVMYTSSFYEKTAGKPSEPVESRFSKNNLPLQYVPSRHLGSRGSVAVSSIDHWLSQTIKLEIQTPVDPSASERASLAELTNMVIQMCYQYEYPYDVIMCNRGREVYVFVRKYQKPLEEVQVNPACVELTGIVVYRSEECFNNADEKVLMDLCADAVLFKEEDWMKFTDDITKRIDNKNSD